LTRYGCPLHFIKARNVLRSEEVDGGPVSFVFATVDLTEQAVRSLTADGYRSLGEVRALDDGRGEVTIGR